jgi:hypothetical protein
MFFVSSVLVEILPWSAHEKSSAQFLEPNSTQEKQKKTNLAGQ